MKYEIDELIKFLNRIGSEILIAAEQLNSLYINEGSDYDERCENNQRFD